MNNVSKIEKITMDSREIAKLTGKEHRNVTRDIRRQLEEQEISLLTFEHSHHNTRGKKYKHFKLDHTQTMILLSGYSIPLRAKIIKRWEELEKKGRIILPDFTKPAVAARAWADEVEQKEIAQTKVKHLSFKIEEQKDAVAFHKAVTDSKDAISMDEVSRVLDMGYGRNNLFKFLRNHRVLMSTNLPYQRYINAGYFRVIEQKHEGIHSEIKITFKTLVHQKGVDFIRNLIEKSE